MIIALRFREDRILPRWQQQIAQIVPGIGKGQTNRGRLSSSPQPLSDNDGQIRDIGKIMGGRVCTGPTQNLSLSHAPLQ